MSEPQQTINPYEGFKLLREHAPVSQLEADGPWQVARHADVNAILRDHATFSSDVSMQPQEKRGAPSMLFSDPPAAQAGQRSVQTQPDPTSRREDSAAM